MSLRPSSRWFGMWYAEVAALCSQRLVFSLFASFASEPGTLSR